MNPDHDALQAEVHALLPDITVSEVLSTGVGGTVMRATHGGRPVVLKRIRNRSARRKQAEREIAMLRTGQGPHVVRLESTYRSDTYVLIELEYLEQPSLRDRLHERWTAADLVATARSIASALARLHHEDILFNDLKPRNVGVTAVTPCAAGDGGGDTGVSSDTVAASDGLVLTAKLIDFGHARTIADTRTQAFAGGSLDYMPPECVREGILGPWSDVWSWARSWHLLASGNYFGRFENVNQLFRFGSRRLPPIGQVSRVVLPEQFARLIDQSLAVDHAHRPADGQHLVDELDQIIADEWGERHRMPTRFSIQVD